jgi:hypothetical protein
VLEVGKEEPEGVMKTMHGRGDPRQGRRHVIAWDVGARGRQR